MKQNFSHSTDNERNDHFHEMNNQFEPNEEKLNLTFNDEHDDTKNQKRYL